MDEKITESIRFKRKVSKFGNNYYIAIPLSFVESGYIIHGKKYEVQLTPIEDKKHKSDSS